MSLSRRKLLIGASVAAFAPRLGWAGTAERINPRSIAVGDVGTHAATLWARGRREGRLVIQLATNPDFHDNRELQGAMATADTDFTARLRVEDLPAGERMYWRATLDAQGDRAEWMTGSFLTAGAGRDVRFVWGGDTGGQGYGINDQFGGMRIFDAIRQHRPDFVIHAGDLVYSDGPMEAEVDLPGGGTWHNLITPEVAKVAESLEEFRGRFRYNHIDEHFRAMLSEVPILHMWDDHEYKNNWYPGKPVRDKRYEAKNINELIPRARRAFFEYTPIEGGQMYRKVAYGPLLDVFMLDCRSYRGPNSNGRQTWYHPGTHWLGPFQRDWLKVELARSKARWKVVVNSMPLGIQTRGGGGGPIDNATNGSGPPLGRELEIAHILRYLRESNVKNVVWLTADLHYGAATHYSPARGTFKEFDPFWEFMAGPWNAGTGKLHKLDPTFGARSEWESITRETRRHASPAEGHQFYGLIEIASGSGELTVSFHDQEQKLLHRQTLTAV
jgi:alkaline phosphatase D